jgi:hypothetical protein
VAGTIPSFIAPSSKTYLNVGRELVTGTTVLGTVTFPMDKNDYSPEDTPKFLPDEAIRGVMSPLFNEIRGVENSTFSYGGPAFLDVEGYWLDNTFGDLSSTSQGTLGSAITLGTALAIGATQLTVGTANSLGTVTTGSIIQIGDGAASEIVIATAGSNSNTVNFVNNPTRFAHTTAATAALQTIPGGYTHTFAILNTGSGQPPTHTVTDYTGLTPTVGARSYPSSCVSQFDFSGNAEELLMHKVAGMGWISAPATGTPTLTSLFTLPQANWESTITIAGTPVYNIGNWSVSIKRALQTYWTALNAQNPYVIARGGLGLTWNLDFTVAVDESPLSDMLTSGYQSVVMALTNGLTGVNKLGVTITTSRAQAVKSKPTRNAVLVGYSTEWEATANSTDIGGSGGIGPGTVTIYNATPTY